MPVVHSCFSGADTNGDGYADHAVGVPGQVLGKSPFRGGAVTLLRGGKGGLTGKNSLQYDVRTPGVEGHPTEANDSWLGIVGPTARLQPRRTRRTDRHGRREGPPPPPPEHVVRHHGRSVHPPGPGGPQSGNSPRKRRPQENASLRGDRAEIRLVRGAGQEHPRLRGDLESTDPRPAP
ncbi:FG-GAP repeat protein [Streptomyces sp. NPDC056909]|uniref:FG-GAP repeat protein n=1 Tax=Streptomyces sp. NPDC056909 TaxID=3345963 RepID=UPI0036A737F5